MAKEEPKERILTEQEIRRLVERSEAPLRHIILVALNTGMRKAEILNLEWYQVNLEEGFIRIEAQRSKKGKIRMIPLNKSLSELFYKLHYSRNGSQCVFENPKTGKAFFCINRRWRKLVNSFEVPESESNIIKLKEAAR